MYVNIINIYYVIYVKPQPAPLGVRVSSLQFFKFIPQTEGSVVDAEP